MRKLTFEDDTTICVADSYEFHIPRFGTNIPARSVVPTDVVLVEGKNGTSKTPKEVVRNDSTELPYKTAAQAFTEKEVEPWKPPGWKMGVTMKDVDLTDEEIFDQFIRMIDRNVAKDENADACRVKSVNEWLERHMK